MASSSDRGVLYELLRSFVYIMHVKIARKKAQGMGREKGNYVWYSCVPIIRCYALPIIRFIRTKFANFVPRKTRTFRIPFDTHKFDVSARAYFPMPHSRLS